MRAVFRAVYSLSFVGGLGISPLMSDDSLRRRPDCGETRQSQSLLDGYVLYLRSIGHLRLDLPFSDRECAYHS